MSQSDRALIIGVSQYPSGISSLPAVAADVREISQLLGSSNGVFQPSAVTLLSDANATKANVTSALRDVFGNAGRGDTLFVYLAGHGTVDHTGDYHYIPYDTKLTDIAGTSIPLKLLKQAFDSCVSEKVLLWLDFCHSGGILARDLSRSAADSATAAVQRSLAMVQGRGKVIMCACTADQKAYEDVTHGHFTRFLLKGLRGDAANAQGEVTASSLHDYIDYQMGSAQQRPMFFGSMTGRIILMHSRAVSISGNAEVSVPSPTSKPVVIVSDSGPWVMLDNAFFKSSAVNQDPNGEIEVEIPSEGSEDDAAIRGLSSTNPWSRKPVAFAYRNDALIVRVKQVTSRSSNGKQFWRITLAPEQVDYGGGFMSDMALKAERRTYSGDDIAELRARRLLLNDPPASNEKRRHYSGNLDMLDVMIEGVNNPYPAKHCVLQQFTPEIRKNPEQFLQFARLSAIFALKAGHVFEHVTELRFGPFVDGGVEVLCRGKRRKVYSNRPATELTIQGTCAME